MRGPYRKRRIHEPPAFKSFKPGGVPAKLLKTITLTVDEYEAIRLADYEGMDHLNAADSMQISRRTFSRVVERARFKIAQALIDGFELFVSGGNIEFAQTRHRCRDCGDEFSGFNNQKNKDCPGCGSENIHNVADDFINYKRKGVKK